MAHKLSFEDLPGVIFEQGRQLEQINKTLSNFSPIPTPVLSKRYTLPEAAEYCRMAIPTFRSYLSKRKVSGTKFGKNWIFSQQDLDDFIDKYRVKTIDELNIVASDSLIVKRK